MKTIQLYSQIAKAVKSLPSLETVPEFDLVITSNPKFGDYACNVAMLVARVLNQPPRELASELAGLMGGIEGVAAAEVAGPGFINLKMTGEYWAAELKNDSRHNDRKGRLQLEFISANPTGPLTLANARGGFVGDTLAAVLSEDGWEVEREFYVNDSGGQVAKLAESVRAEAGYSIDGERQYQGEYITELTKAAAPYLEAADLAQRLVEIVIKDYLKPAVKRMNISFDTWFSERSLVASDEMSMVLTVLESLGLVEDREGAKWLRSVQMGDERDRVLIRSSGEPTYLLGDLAYHYNIFRTRGFDRAIKIWGADHAGQVESLKLGIKAIAPDAEIDFVLLQFVRLLREGVEVKMSKRAGTYVTIDELLDMLSAGVGPEHAVNVARWFFLARSCDNRIDFDLDLAREESQKNPYFYVMYAYARACSLVKRAEEAGLKAKAASRISAEVEINLAKGIITLNQAITHVAHDYGVQRLPHVGYELAKTFTTLYESERILDLTGVEAANRLYVVQRYIESIEHLFRLMGVKAVREMGSPVVLE